MDLNGVNLEWLIVWYLLKFLYSFGCDFVGVLGLWVYNVFVWGEFLYWLYCFEKV